MNDIKLNFDVVKTSYSNEDVVVLLKDLSGEMCELDTASREALIQSGKHYSEMLPEENRPSAEYIELYNKAIENNKDKIVIDIAKLAEQMIRNCKEKPIIVSLARAGIPVGILVKRYIKYKYNIDCNHYAISIVRDKGIDYNALNYIYNIESNNSKFDVSDIMFVDGWTGKGVIKNELVESVNKLKEASDIWYGLSGELYVLADPANSADYCGTHEDYLLPSACLNSTVSGLISRTVLNDMIDVDNGEFHGAVYYKKFEDIDNSNKFVDTISELFKTMDNTVDYFEVVNDVANFDKEFSGMNVVKDLCSIHNIPDYKKAKPGIGETTRVLLRRIPWKVFINKDVSADDPDVAHILLMCRNKNIPIMRWDLGNYKVCGVIKELSADA